MKADKKIFRFSSLDESSTSKYLPEVERTDADVLPYPVTKVLLLGGRQVYPPD